MIQIKLMGFRMHQALFGVETYNCLGLILKSMVRGPYSIFCVLFQPTVAHPSLPKMVSPSRASELPELRAGLLGIWAGRQLRGPLDLLCLGRGGLSDNRLTLAHAEREHSLQNTSLPPCLRSPASLS